MNAENGNEEISDKDRKKNDKKVTIQFGTRIGGSKNYITLMILNIVGLGISFFYRCQ